MRRRTILAVPLSIAALAACGGAGAAGAPIGSLFALGAPGQSPQLLPPSNLPLALVGAIVDAAVPSNSGCLIRCAFPVQRVRTFGPGQSVCGVAEIKEVRQDAVVIRNLLTNRLELVALQEATPSTTMPPRSDAQVPARAEPAPPPPVVRKSSDVVTIELPEASVKRYLANLPELLSARATPRYRDTGIGQRTIEGFEIDQIKTAGVVEQMGLKNGDVILELNGQSLDSLASVMRLFAQAQGVTQPRMTVLRNGQRMTFSSIGNETGHDAGFRCPPEQGMARPAPVHARRSGDAGAGARPCCRRVHGPQPSYALSIDEVTVSDIVTGLN